MSGRVYWGQQYDQSIHQITKYVARTIPLILY